MGMMLNLGVVLAGAGVVAAVLLCLLYLSLLREVRSALTWGLFAFSVAALVGTLLELAIFLLRGSAIGPDPQGPVVTQAGVLAFALVVLAFTTWMPQGTSRPRRRVIR